MADESQRFRVDMEKRLQQAQIEALRKELGVKRNGNTLSCSLNTDSTDRDNWPQMIDWLHNRLEDVRRIITQVAAADDALPEQ